MRILALVGPGTVGRVAVARAARLPGRHEITVGDRDLGAARRLALELSDADVRLAAREVDVTHPSGLAAALEEADVVLNAGGAYDQFGPAVLWAAIRTRTHYLDVCDDWESTVRMLELDGDARAAGVCAVLGMGASPGISNLLAARAVARLDEVTDLYTQCNGLPLRAPNDLVFDGDGGFWFTDHGIRHERSSDRTGIFYARADGSSIAEVVFPVDAPNGIGLSPDGRMLYAAETFSTRPA